jgi:pyrroloquinoline quinone biosynthesis protein B
MMKLLLLGAEGSAARAAALSDGSRWVLLNAPTDLERHFQRHPQLQAQPLAGVVLMDARMDHVAGLLELRGGPPVELYATPAVFETLTTELPLLQVVDRCCGVRWHLLPVAGDSAAAPFRIDAMPSLRFTAFAAGDEHAPGATLALEVEDLRDGRRLLYWPGPWPLPLNHGADCLLLGDGGTDMPDASTALRVLLHPAAPPAEQPARQGASAMEQAFDGMEIEL